MPRRNPPHFIPVDRDKPEQRKQRYQKRTTERIGTASERGYDHTWAEYAKAFLAQHPWCIACMDGPTDAKLVDHIVPVIQGVEGASGQYDVLFFESVNHQPLCTWHHAQKTRHDKAMQAHRAYAMTLLADPNGRDLLLSRCRLWGRWVGLNYETITLGMRGLCD
jgi:5-methylcytosine-specific restriction protein A